MNDIILNNNFDGIEYIIENDTLYFDTKTIALLGDSNERTVYRHCNTVLNEYLTIDNFDNRLYITKKVGKTQKKFYSHYIVGDVLHRLKSPKAIEFRIWSNEKIFRKPEQPKSLEPNHIDVAELESKRSDLQGVQKSDSELISRLNHRAKRLEQNGDMEELERTRETLLDISNEFTEISLVISDITELTKAAKTVTKLSPKVTGNKYFNQNYLVPFKKS